MKTIILFALSFSAMAFAKTELNCSAKSSASLHDDTTQTRSVATHKPVAKQAAKKATHQR